MNQKHEQTIYHANVNANFMEELVIQINGGIMINVDVGVKKRHVCEKDYIWNAVTYKCEKGKYLASFMDNSVITCDEIIESYNKDTNFNEKSNL